MEKIGVGILSHLCLVWSNESEKQASKDQRSLHNQGRITLQTYPLWADIWAFGLAYRQNVWWSVLRLFLYSYLHRTNSCTKFDRVPRKRLLMQSMGFCVLPNHEDGYDVRSVREFRLLGVENDFKF